MLQDKIIIIAYTQLMSYNRSTLPVKLRHESTASLCIRQQSTAGDKKYRDILSVIQQLYVIMSVSRVFIVSSCFLLNQKRCQSLHVVMNGIFSIILPIVSTCIVTFDHCTANNLISFHVSIFLSQYTA